MGSSKPRSTNACESCRQRKVKCSGDQPCPACVKHGWECVFGTSGRKRYSEAQVKHLLEKVQSYEDQLALLSSRSELPSPAPQSNHTRPSRHAESTTPDRNLANINHHGGHGNFISPSPAANLTPGLSLESRDRSLPNIRSSYTRQPPGTFLGSIEQSELNQWTSVRTLVDDVCDETSNLSQEESQHLLDQFLFYLAVNQHFFEARSFADSMALLFQTPETREQQKRTIWFVQYLLVMAMAKLMDVEKHTARPPGLGLFQEALKRLPPLHILSGEGAIAVEILTLIATYLQSCDRLHDAYIHIGLAMRIAIALGCNLPENEQRCPPSQSAHRARLWWTVYMLDTRLSSALGLAAGASEQQLHAGYPQHAPGFQSPIAITINVRIARVTNEIMSSLYNNNSLAQLELVGKVQSILHELYDIGRSFPRSLVLDFNRPLQTVTRTGSSLYLMLFQAIILCTRPILLQMVRMKVKSQQLAQPLEPVHEALARLCDTGNEAATRSLAILSTLQQQRTIPHYGFSDLDATFSAAFVLVMIGFIDTSNHSPPPALVQAFQVLHFLSQSGNQSAGQRFQCIAQSCSHVWPGYDFNEPQQPTNATHPYNSTPNQQLNPPIPQSTPSQRSPSHPSAPPPYYKVMVSESGQYCEDESRLLEPRAFASGVDAMFDMQGHWDFDLSCEAEGIYSSFHDPELPLTGVDYMDWMEIEKVFGGEL